MNRSDPERANAFDGRFGDICSGELAIWKPSSQFEKQRTAATGNVENVIRRCLDHELRQEPESVIQAWYVGRSLFVECLAHAMRFRIRFTKT
jgi:hypothetical protein